MRAAFAVVILLGVTALSVAQDDEPPPPRYGEKSRPQAVPATHPQGNARVGTRIKGERRIISYPVAHLLEPKFVDDAVTERAKLP